MKKIVITGATSMIGVALIEEILHHESIQKIYAVVKTDTKNLIRIPIDTRIEIIKCDMDNYHTLPYLINDFCEIFYNLAWIRTSTYNESVEDVSLKCRNINAVIEAVKAAYALGCTKFIGAGSQSEYGNSNANKLSPQTPCHPVRADGVIHLAAGTLAQILCTKLGINCIWMRIFSVYGRFDRMNSMISSTISKLKQGVHCSFTASEQMWDYLSAWDVGKAFYLVGEKVCKNQVYCVGWGEAKPLRSYIELIRDIVSPKTKLIFGELPYPTKPIMNLCADVTALKEDTGWSPEIEFEDGIKKLYFEDKEL